jgi:type II secretory pathway component GspD/PulD (secretin)
MRAGSEFFASPLFRALALWLMLGAAAMAAELAVQVVPLRHRLPDEVIPALRPLLQPNESINGYDARLIVRASPATLKQIERVLGEIDSARRNLRISVRMDETIQRQEQDLGVSGEAHTGNTRIVVTNGAHSDRGASVGVRGSSGNVQAHTERRVTTRNDNLSHTLTVLDGGRGFLRIGESIPQVQTYLALIGHRPGLVTGIQYYDVTTGFEVEPRVIGERVQLTLSPRMAFRSSQGNQVVEMRELRTTVMVTPGEWTDIGGVVESANEVNRAILSGQARTRAHHNSFQVKVDPLP